MTFVDRLKERIKKRAVDMDEDRLSSLRNNPKYAQVFDKLNELIIQRDMLYKQLAKVEIDIDSCLVLLSIGMQKDDIEDL